MIRPNFLSEARISALALSRFAAALGLLLGTIACSSTAPTTPVEPRFEPRTEPFLIAPLDGYPKTVDMARGEEVTLAWQRLTRGEALSGVVETAQQLLAEEPSLDPAAVLLAETDLLNGDASAAAERLRLVVEEVPDYAAAALVYGTALEALDKPVAALEAYHAVASQNERAAARMAALLPEVSEDLYIQLDDALRRRRVRAAERLLGRLEELGVEPEARRLLDARRRLAFARGDEQAELELLRRLAEDAPQEAELERLGELELEIGEPRRGLEIYEDLAQRRPDDAAIAESLARAKLLWRLGSLPQEIRDLAASPRLERASLAALLYWLVPEVRYTQVNNPPIATDILDHVFREEALRVVNLGLMEVNEALHTFSPDLPATRVSTLAALLRLLRLAPRDHGCLSIAEASRLPFRGQLVCTTAADCGLLRESADCLPRAALSGEEALVLFHRALDLLGAS